MGCKFEYKGQWYEEIDLLNLYHEDLSIMGRGDFIDTTIEPTPEDTLSTFEELASKENVYNQITGTEGSKASTETVNRLKEWLNKIGVKVRDIPYINSKGEKVDANGKARLLENIIEIVEGKQNVALVEEAMHFATYIVQQTNPALYKKMLNNIEKYSAYRAIFDTYKSTYTKDGKPDVPKIKFEAIGKILAEYYIQTEEGSTELPELLEQRKGWIQSIIDWFKNLFYKHGNPFQEALSTLETAAPLKRTAYSLVEGSQDLTIQTTIDTTFDELEGGGIHRTKVLDNNEHIGTILTENDGTYLTVFDTDIRSNTPNTGTFAYLRLAQEAQSQGLTLRSDRITDRMSEAAQRLWNRFVKGGQATIQEDRYIFMGDPNEVVEGTFLQINPQLITKLDKTSAEVVNKPIADGDNAYFIGDKQVKQRVTKLIKEKAKDKFKKPTPIQQAVYDQFRDWGSRGHRDMEAILGAYLTSEGTVVKVDGQLVRQNTTPIQSEVDPTNKGIFDTLHDYVKELLLSYPDNTVFRLEQTIYSDRGGKPGEKDIAGTMDFVAIQPTGKVDILDWKFRKLAKDQKDDLPWYTQQEWNLQMLEYKKILKREYGLKDVDFGKTRMIPIMLSYTATTTSKDTKFIPEDVELAGLDLKIGEKSYLLPVVTPDESTGNKELDSLIHSLTELYNTIKDIPAPDRQKNIKNEQLNNLLKAIRHLQVAQNFGPLTEQVGILIKDSKRVIEEHKTKFESLTDLTEQQISEEAANLLLKAQALHLYQNLSVQFGEFYGENPSKEEIEILANLSKVTEEARTAYKKINDIIKDFGEKYIAERRGVEALLKEEKSVTGLTRNFGTSSELPTAAMQTLFLMIDNANNKIQFELNDIKDEIVEIKKDIDKWGGLKKLLPLIKKTPDPKKKSESEEEYKRRLAREGNKLIDEYDGEFYSQLQDAIREEDLDWIKSNIDMDAFKKHLKERQVEIKQVIEETRYSYDDLENEDKKRQALEKLALTTNPTKLEAYFEKNQYYILKKFPLEQWRSDEYKKLKENAPAFKFYEFIRKLNERAREIGYLEGNKAERNFLPYLYKSFSEKINLGGIDQIFNGMGDALFSNLTIDENVAGYGKYNPLTEQIEDSLPTYFTREIENPNLVSEDLFLNIAAYAKAVVNYDHKSQIDGQVKALYFIEQNKKSLRVNTFGKLIRVNGLPVKQESNDQNSDLLQNHIKALQYGQKYTSVESTDALLGDWAKGVNKVTSSINKKLGSDIIPQLSEGKEVSLTRFMDGINRFFTIKNMGLNVATSASVLAGGNFQAIINSGKYYTKEQFLASEFQHAAHKVIGNQKVHLALIKNFMPIDEELGREINKLATGKLTGNSFGDFMMFMMRKSDHIVQYGNFLSFMKNTIIIDGKLYNAREYYRNSKEYANRYNLPEGERIKMEKEFESKVSELIKNQGIEKLSSVDEKGNLAIKGISSIKNDNVYSYRTLITSIGKRATGNVSPENEMLIRMNAIFRSMLVFKNWIPGLVKQRVGGLRHDAATQTYEYGRLRMLIKHLGPLALFKVGTITDILKANDKGVANLKEYFKNQKESYTNKTDKELNMQESEFMDMFRQNLQNQIKELGILISMIAIVTAILPLFKPDDDEEQEIKNRFKFASRLLDKVKDEVWFYYNPVGLQQILNGSIFPALGIFTDAARVVQSTMTEIYGVATGDEDLTEKNFALKNLMKALPLTKELTYYIAMFNADLAKELGIQISSQSRMK